MTNEETPSAPRIGTVLEDRYELLEELGSGGVGWVYRATHIRLGTGVAIKMLKAPYAQHELLRPRFEREAKALAALRHPHIVSLTDYSIAEDGHPYLVMELLEGQTLADLIGEGPVEESRARHIALQILDALIYAHEQGFAHRDMKPGNVFLVELPTDRDHVKILDFGFVKLMGVSAGDDKSRPLTRSGIAFGTPSYMCPEQATGGATDPRSDLYSTTVVLFEMLAGRRPFVGEIPEVIRAHLTEPVPPLSVGGHGRVAGAALTRLLERGMAKEPIDRFQSAAEMKEALLALPERAVFDASSPRPAEDETGAATVSHDAISLEPELPPEPPSPAPRRGWVLSVLAGLALAGVAGVGWALWERGDETAAETAAPPRPQLASSGAAESDPVDLDLTGPDEPLAAPAEAPVEPPASPTAPPTAEVLEPGSDEAPATAELANEPPGDPWSERPAVPALDAARRVVTRGRPLPPPREEELRRYVREHRDDPRGHLVLAQHYVARGHTITAARRYALAYRVDARATGDPRMLPDLVRLAAHPGAATEAAALLAEAFGVDALSEIDRLLATGELDRRSVGRLRAARDAISPPGE